MAKIKATVVEQSFGPLGKRPQRERFNIRISVTDTGIESEARFMDRKGWAIAKGKADLLRARLYEVLADELSTHDGGG